MGERYIIRFIDKVSRKTYGFWYTGTDSDGIVYYIVSARQMTLFYSIEEVRTTFERRKHHLPANCLTDDVSIIVEKMGGGDVVTILKL